MINKTTTIRNTYALSIFMLLAFVLVSLASCGKVATTSSKLAGNRNGMLWQHQLSKDVTHIIVANFVVYADTSADHNAPTVYAFNSATGSELWHYTTNIITPGLLATTAYNALNWATQLKETTGVVQVSDV